jgi:hypothetical protein
MKKRLFHKNQVLFCIMLQNGRQDATTSWTLTLVYILGTTEKTVTTTTTTTTTTATTTKAGETTQPPITGPTRGKL